MMKNKIIMFLILLMIGVLTACGNTSESPENTNTDEVNELEEEVEEDSNPPAETETEESEGNEGQDESAEPGESVPEENTGDHDVETVTEDVTYTGLADPHTIEVESEDGTIALQILDFMDDDWESIEMGIPMTIEYYKNEQDQFILTDYTH